MSDDQIRARALDPERSFIVQAPAGSGKTELLIRRYLKLLARVDSPEAVVAITFTKKAAGEMRARVLQALHTDNPARLRIQTIDSLCASITRQMPWLARFGAPPEITEKAQDLYLEAARNTLRMVAEEERSGTLGPLSTLLLHLDNNFGQAESLIADMLEKRDQWLRHTGVNPDLAQVRAELEGTLERWIQRELQAVRAAIPADAIRDVLLLLDMDELPAAESDGLPGWLNVADLILTKAGGLRRQAPKGLPRERWNRLMDRLRGEEQLLAKLKEARRLPPARFDDTQWKTMEAVVDVLPKAVAHLQLVFEERGRVDFAELSIRASEALGRLDSPTDLGLALGCQIQHLLVDEFQDTSFTQYELLRKLTSGWEPGDGRTLFLVGDPMQSIYRFRQADVSLFAQAREEGLGQIQLEPLTLNANFRSDPAIVDWVNESFGAILPSYSPSISPSAASSTGRTPMIHAFVDDTGAEEAERVIELIREAGADTAILVRARSHLVPIVAALRQRRILFQAIEIDALGERAVIQDLMALTFALVHLGDRVSWLAILRAPWCGLTIEDLHAIAAGDSRAAIWDLVRRKDLRLTADGSARLARCMRHIEAALDRRGRVPLRTLVEQTWTRLGGPACVANDSDLEDAAAYFDLLEMLEEAGDLYDFEALRKQVSELFAQPDSEAGRLQIMTIHKAKGLEFDTVILPGLGQRPRPDDRRLLLWQEQQGELLLAPMAGTGDEKDPIYDYLAHLDHEKGRQETVRLLYVAATRARNHLHLLGSAHVSDKQGEVVAPETGSFLKLLWPVVGAQYIAKAVESGSRVPAAAAVGHVKPVRLIQRLVSNWTLPAPPPAVTWRRESLEPVDAPEVAFEWVGDTLRHVGTATHVFMQRIAADGADHWDAVRLVAHRPAIQTYLTNLGVAPLDLAEATGRVEKALTQTLKDEQGRWILASHSEAENECQLTGMLDGKLYQARIDRTFIDELGVRWIIDYKTSVHEGGSLENFLEEERVRYQERLERYARLLIQRDPQREERPIRLALYFPLLNAWKEWAAPVIKRRQASLFE